jgi:hypothetical protein
MTADELDELLHAKTIGATKIWESIARGAQLYSTPLFSLKLTSDGDRLDLAGSGTYIREGERYFILTAAHVWHNVLKDSDFVGVTLREIDDHRCFIETKAIVPRGPVRPEVWNNLGPDIVSLEIPPSRVGEIKALRGFYEMDGGLKAMVKVDRSEAYLLVGTPGELGSFTQNHASVQLLGLWDGVPVAFKAGDLDYFDFKARLHPDTPAGSFGGVSGGGLWRVQIYPHPESGEVESTVALEGVAFWEHGTSHGQGVIRCHGVESVRKVLEDC